MRDIPGHHFGELAQVVAQHVNKSKICVQALTIVVSKDHANRRLIKRGPKTLLAFAQGAKGQVVGDGVSDRPFQDLRSQLVLDEVISCPDSCGLCVNLVVLEPGNDDHRWCRGAQLCVFYQIQSGRFAKTMIYQHDIEAMCAY